MEINFDGLAERIDPTVYSDILYDQLSRESQLLTALAWQECLDGQGVGLFLMFLSQFSVELSFVHHLVYAPGDSDLHTGYRYPEIAVSARSWSDEIPSQYRSVLSHLRPDQVDQIESARHVFEGSVLSNLKQELYNMGLLSLDFKVVHRLKISQTNGDDPSPVCHGILPTGEKIKIPESVYRQEKEKGTRFMTGTVTRPIHSFVGYDISDAVTAARLVC